MRKNLAEIIFILDHSGSMSGLEADTIGGFSSIWDRMVAVCHSTLHLFLFSWHRSSGRITTYQWEHR